MEPLNHLCDRMPHFALRAQSQIADFAPNGFLGAMQLSGDRSYAEMSIQLRCFRIDLPLA
jgi:hypothetical protein